MKSFKQFIAEMPSLVYGITRDTFDPEQIDHPDNNPMDPSTKNKKHWRKVHSTSTHDVWVQTPPKKKARIAAVNRKTKKTDVHVNGFMSDNNEFHETEARSRKGNKMKIPELYSHALEHGGIDSIQSDYKQTPGMKKSWERLAKNRKISISANVPKRADAKDGGQNSKPIKKSSELDKYYYPAGDDPKSDKEFTKKTRRDNTNFTAKLRKKKK